MKNYMKETECIETAATRLNHARIDAKIALALYQIEGLKEMHKKVDQGEELSRNETDWINGE